MKSYWSFNFSVDTEPFNDVASDNEYKKIIEKLKELVNTNDISEVKERLECYEILEEEEN